MISTDTTNTGAGTVTPPAVGMCSADQVVLTAPYAAPWTGTGLPAAGTASPFRLRGLIAAGAALGGTARPSVQTTALPEFAVVGVPVEHPSSTPGDLPPEDPLS
ncbi:hypothetical protein [Modestobacter altitudinis]|uniref:hypothetical protein n=1 Tax=Modestobacter altitudinis TaxID=2213158 RepID=UPI00110C9980|nr:hypothetical protein [Modestobacter altitudinis]